MSSPQAHQDTGVDLTRSHITIHPLPAAKLENPSDVTLPHFLNACENADISTISLLAKARNVNDGSLHWGLYRALKANRVDVVRLLLEQGVTIDQRAVMETKTQECFQALLDYGWKVNDLLESRGTVFPRVLALKNESLVRWFLSQGTDIEFGSPFGGMVVTMMDQGPPLVCGSHTTLDAAARTSTPAIFDLLISHGANFDKSLPLHNTVTSIWLTSEERIAMMAHALALGADINQSGLVAGCHTQKSTPLHGAAAWGRPAEAKWLLEHGAEVRSKNARGWHPSGEARLNHQTEVTKMLEDWELSKYGDIQ